MGDDTEDRVDEMPGIAQCERRADDAWNSWEWETNVGDARTWTQRLTRSHDRSGIDRFDGWLRLALPADRRVVPLHLPIFPPMATPPRLELEPESGPEVEIVATAIYRQGIRLEIRRTHDIGTDEELILHLELVAGVHND